jgi:uncharacterized damage-inducible protein DinB
MLEQLVTYNRWANHETGRLLGRLTSSQLLSPPPGEERSPLQTLHHLVEVEWHFLALLSDDVPGEPPAEGASLPSLVALLDALDGGFAAQLPTLDPTAMVHVPWFGQDITRGDAALQAMLHAHQHRTDLTWAAYRCGLQTPALDYIVHRLGVDPYWTPGD